ncbi:NADH-quinone oxidoreductase subunit C [Streptomyces bohaiensis]|uniref:NADH-quinone oxidoreductase subunit C n=1 Tax=Streptomyces bohaiensis TaxID=1431344 RepID=UPI0030C725CC
MTGWLPEPVEELFGPDATAAEAYGTLTVDVPAAEWTAAATTARSRLGCDFFDWLSAVDEPGTGFLVCLHLVALPGGAAGAAPRALLLRTTVPHDTPELPTLTGLFAGAAWHERETHEMFGVRFAGHPGLEPLLLPDGFEGHPLRKDFVLAARVVKAWPGAKEPGEAGSGAPRRRQMLPPGVPDPNEWGPLKGTLPDAPARRAAPARGAARRRPGGPDAPTGTNTEPTGTEAGPPGAAPESAGGAPDAATPRRPRRTRSASGGSASQRDAGEATGTAPEAAPGGEPRRPRRSRSASDGSASQRAAGTGPVAPVDGPAVPGRRSTDAPWHAPEPADAPKRGEADQPDSAVTRSDPAAATEGASTTEDADRDGGGTATGAPAARPADPGPADPGEAIGGTAADTAADTADAADDETAEGPADRREGDG